MSIAEDPRLGRIADSHPYPLLFATISGAHLYGFESPDSDFDLRGVHILPLQEVIGLKVGKETLERAELVEGLDLDLVTHDLGKFCRLMSRRNGYVLEQLLSPLVVRSSADHRELVALAPRLFTRAHSLHYLGFAETQRKLLAKEDPPKVKALLYLYRVLMTGIHLMRAGRVEANLNVLNDEFRLAWIPDLIGRKRTRTEKTSLDPHELEFHLRECGKLRETLEYAATESELPEAPPGVAALHDFLVRVRLQRNASCK